MGIIINLLFSFIHLALVGIDLTVFFVLVRILSYRWHPAWLKSFDSVGKPLLDTLNNYTVKFSYRITHATFSKRVLLIINLITLVIIRILLIALFMGLV